MLPIEPQVNRIVVGAALVTLSVWLLFWFLPDHRPMDELELAANVADGLMEGHLANTVNTVTRWTFFPNVYPWTYVVAALFGMAGLASVIGGATYRPPELFCPRCQTTVRGRSTFSGIRCTKGAHFARPYTARMVMLTILILMVGAIVAMAVLAKTKTANKTANSDHQSRPASAVPNATPTTPAGPALADARLQLSKLSKTARIYFAMNADFPVGHVGSTPVTPCCRGANGECPPQREDWTNPVWQTLDFQIDEPHRFQYTWDSDGKTFTAKAVGDPECTGNTVTLVLRGTSENGVPRMTLSE
jgi:hypothetical protein